ncbi:hypothetical protein Hanom_Chr05g00428331 [Helianthus anomalus]
MMDKESKVSKTQTKGDEPVLDASTSVAQTSVVEPIAPGDHDTTTGVVKPTPAKPKKKPSTSKKPTKTKQHKKAHLEDEIPEDNLVTVQKSPETIVATSSQQLVRSPPNQTPLESSQKDQVVSTGTPHHEAAISVESLFQSPSPRDMSLSTPQTSTPISPTFLPLLDAIETQTLINPFHSPVKESTLPHMTEYEENRFANPEAAEEATPLKFHETLGGSSDETTTTTGKPIGIH